MSELQTTDKKINAWDSFILTIFLKEAAVNLFLPLINCTVEYEGDRGKLIVHHDLSVIKDKVKLGEKANVCIDYTDDPTPVRAGAVVSLGYPLYRFEGGTDSADFYCTVTSFNPLTFEASRDQINSRINREQRDSLLEVEIDKEIFNADFQLTSTSTMKRFHRFYPGFITPVELVTMFITSDRFILLVELVDMTSFYEKAKCVLFKDFNNAEELQKAYEEECKKSHI